MQQKAVRMQSIARAMVTEEKHVRSGRYRSSIKAEVVNEGGTLTIRFGSNVPYAHLLEHGSPPHEIHARGALGRTGAKALWWDMPNDRGWMPWPDDGRPVPYVFHPGNEGYHILARATRRALSGALIPAA
jgi:hypothetical protein